MAGQPEGQILNSGHFITPHSLQGLRPDPLLKNGSATVQIYSHHFLRTLFQQGLEKRPKHAAMWCPKIHDETGREWMLFCYDHEERGVTYVRLILDCLASGQMDKVEQLKNTYVVFKLILANNKNEFRGDEELANYEYEDGNPKLGFMHNFLAERKLDSGNLLRKDEVFKWFHMQGVQIMVTITCKVGEDMVQFDEKGGVKTVTRKPFP